VEKFLENYPNRELAKANININIIRNILGLHLPNFEITPEEFHLLKSIKPIRFELPFRTKKFPEIIGKPLRKGTGTMGVYLFTNKVNGYQYVGSSINLATRLKDGYFGNLLLLGGRRKIEAAILEHGLVNFYLDVFLIPAQTLSYKAGNIRILHHLVLSLEQMLILELNPKLNEIKVAGSNPGNLTGKNLKKTYLFDSVNKELIYITNGRINMAKIIGCNEGAIKRYLFHQNRLYLKRFFIGDEMPKGGQEYSIKLKSLESLQACLDEVRSNRKLYLTKIRPTRQEANLKMCKKVELTNLVSVTKSSANPEVLIFDSLKEATQYIQKFSPEFSSVRKGTISKNARSGVPYKNTFKLKYID
jgi:group I intron endonuclease